MEQRTAWSYLAYLLRASAALYLGHQPAPEDLRVLAETIHPQVAASVRIDAEAVERTFLTAHELASPDQAIKGGDFVVFGCAAVGAMLTQPDADLERLKQSLARWASNHRSKLTEVIESF